MKVETIKVKMPIITEEELQTIDENFDEMVNKAEEIMVTKKDQVVWQRLLSKQKKTIKDLKERNDKLSSQYRDRDFRCIILEQRNERLQARIDKAIEYIESENTERFGNPNIEFALNLRKEKLLEILKGGEK